MVIFLYKHRLRRRQTVYPLKFDTQLACIDRVQYLIIIIAIINDDDNSKYYYYYSLLILAIHR